MSLDDAPYYSALYGPSRHAIVVPDLSLIADQLEGPRIVRRSLPDRGDPQSFDDSVFSVDELEKAVVVKIADRQWRYSRFPTLPLFGRAAREKPR